jgi:hypothetical protein
MGAVTMADLGPLYWGAGQTARAGFLRLTKLGILRTFPRSDPSRPQWYSLTAEGLEWVLSEVDCAEEELRRYAGLARVNLAALSARNRFWVTLLRACRRTPDFKVTLFTPEWELRRAKPEGVAIVPDALAVLTRQDGSVPGGTETALSHAYMLEFDSGAERSIVWQEKAKCYGALAVHGRLYGASRWSVVALVPTLRRARTVATAISKGGGGGQPDFLLGLSAAVQVDHLLGRVFWSVGDLLQSQGTPSRSLLDSLSAESATDAIRISSAAVLAAGRRPS